MTENTDRRIELEIEVPGSPEEVWAAIATGPGISSWFIPMEVEERTGGTASMRWGEGFPASIADVEAWEPPRRVLFQGREDNPLAFEWLVEARGGGSCVVRLVTSGFGEGADWDAEYDGMAEGWKIFLQNLRLQLTYFPDRAATRTAIPTVQVPGPGAAAWARLCDALGIAPDASEGDRLEAAPGALPLAGRVEGVLIGPASRAYLLVLDDPCPGTGFVAVEGDGESVAASCYLYLHEAEGQALDADLEAQWRRWLEERLGSPTTAAPAG